MNSSRKCQQQIFQKLLFSKKFCNQIKTKAEILEGRQSSKQNQQIAADCLQTIADLEKQKKV